MTVKHAAYTPVSIMNTHWSIAVATPEDYIISDVKGFKNKSIIIMLLFLAVGIVFIYFANRNIILSNEIQNSKRNEAFLKSQEENLRITLNSIGDAVIAADKNGLITRMNPAAEEITGWNFNESKGRPISEIFITFDRERGVKCQNPLDQVLKKRDKIDLLNVINLLQKNGTVIEISGSFAPIYDSHDNPVGVILVFRDITEKNRIAEQLHQTQKMDVVGQLAGGIAHDFNNMLSGIMGSAELLSHEAGDNPKLKRYIGVILESARRSANLTSQLLAFSRKVKTVFTPVDIHGVIRAAIDLLERSIDKKIYITTRLSAENSFTIGDPALLQNAILNLSINARDAMPDGGTISISTSDVVLNQETINHNSLPLDPGNYIEIDVSDTGHGIPKEILPRIFDPFFTTKPVGKGTGLGLSGVYGTVKEHKGAVIVYSEPGSGTIFKIFLPRSDHTPHKSDDPVNQITKGSGCILVIDDESIIRNTAHGILTAAGYDVLLAEDGITGTEIYKTDINRISLVVLDMIMPGISGKETFQMLKLINPEVRVIFASGFNNEGSSQEILTSGAKGFIQKPYMISEFTRLVDEIIRS
jgi:PAS domain S-box-containing protein